MNRSVIVVALVALALGLAAPALAKKDLEEVTNKVNDVTENVFFNA